MTGTKLLLKILPLLVITAVHAQKVKYKDVWALLNTKQYEVAEPFLKTYLKENDDNPNAFLFMGIVLQEKSAKQDVIKNTPSYLSEIDSSLVFFTKAKQTIDEKEIKRNEEYYVAYNRRDLRTGKFGVNLSDVQFDLEKRINSLREKRDKVKMAKHYFKLSDSLYVKCRNAFEKLQHNYASEKELLLRGDEVLLKELQALAVRFDSCTKSFAQYRSAVTALGPGRNPNLVLKDIAGFPRDGTGNVDFYQDNVELWDYKKFATNHAVAIEKDILPLRKHLIAYDIEINKLREKMGKDSTSVRSDLTALIDKLLMEQLKKYDPDPLPMKIFNVKIGDLEYRSVLLEHKVESDSANLHTQLLHARKEYGLVFKLDSMAKSLSGSNIPVEAVNYENFITNTFGTAEVLQSYANGVMQYSAKELEKRKRRLSKIEESLKWIVHGKDSVPLTEVTRPGSFRNLKKVDEQYVQGIYYKDSLNAQGYFFTITPSRKPDVAVMYPLDKINFKLSRLPGIKSITYADPAGQIYYVLVFGERPTKENKYVANVAKIYRSDGLAWSNTFSLAFIPKEMNFNSKSGELVLKADAAESSIDKNGKLVK